MKKIINIVYAFSKTEKTFKAVVTAKNYDQLLPIMERNRDKFSWFVYNIKNKTIHDMYAAYSPGKIQFFRELIGRLETRKSIEYAHGKTKNKLEATKQYMDKVYKTQLESVIENTPKHKLYSPITSEEAVRVFQSAYNHIVAIWNYMEKKRNFTQQLNELQNETIDISKLTDKGFQVQPRQRQKRELCKY